MELTQLNYLLAVIESGSFSKASASLGVAQPALSRQIRNLEKELGFPLLYRHGRGIRPTVFGTRFAKKIEPQVRKLQQALVEVKETEGVPSGKIRIGMPPSLSAAIGAPLIKDFAVRFPHVKLHIMDSFSGFVVEWLLNGRVDMAVINTARKSQNASVEPLLAVKLFLVGHPNLAEGLFSSDDSVFTKSLGSLPLLLPGRHHGLRRTIDTALQKVGVELKNVIEVDSLAVIRELVSDGMGMTVLPQGAIYAGLGNKDFLVRRLVEPEITQSFGMAYSLHQPATIGMRELARALRHQIKCAIVESRLHGTLLSAADSE